MTCYDVNVISAVHFHTNVYYNIQVASGNNCLCTLIYVVISISHNDCPLLQKIIPDSVTKEITGETIDDVFPDSSTASHDPVARPEESAKPITMTTGIMWYIR